MKPKPIKLGKMHWSKCGETEKKANVQSGQKHGFYLKKVSNGMGYIGCNDMEFFAVCGETELLIMELMK